MIEPEIKGAFLALFVLMWTADLARSVARAVAVAVADGHSGDRPARRGAGRPPRAASTAPAVHPSYRPPGASIAAPPPPVAAPPRPNRLWADLMQRSFGFDVLACPRCGHRLELVALIEEAAVIRRILRHLGLPTEVPAARPARPPPLPLGRSGPPDDDIAAP